MVCLASTYMNRSRNWWSASLIPAFERLRQGDDGQPELLYSKTLVSLRGFGTLGRTRPISGIWDGEAWESKRPPGVQPR